MKFFITLSLLRKYPFSVSISALAWIAILIALLHASDVFARVETLELVLVPAPTEKWETVVDGAEVLVRRTHHDGQVTEHRFSPRTGERPHVSTQRRDLWLLQGEELAPRDARPDYWRVVFHGVDKLTRVSCVEGKIEVTPASTPLSNTLVETWDASVHALGHVEHIPSQLGRILVVNGSREAHLPDDWRRAFATLADLLALPPKSSIERSFVLLEVLPEEPALPRLQYGAVDYIQYDGASPLSLEDVLACAAERLLERDRPGGPGSDRWLKPALARLMAVRVMEDLGFYGSRDRRAELLDRYVIGLPSHGRSTLRDYDIKSLSKSLFFEGIYGPLVLCQVAEPLGEGLERWLRVQREVCAGRSLREAVTGQFGEADSDHLEWLVCDTANLATVRIPALVPVRYELATPTLTQQPGRELTFFVTADTENYLESCGCKLRQAGGVARRAWLLNQERSRGTPVVALDLGNAFPPLTQDLLGSTNRAEIRTHLELAALMDYTAIVAGPAELMAGPELLRMLLDGPRPPLVASNLLATEPPWSAGPVQTTAGPFVVHVFGVTARTPVWIRPHEYDRRTSSITIADPTEALMDMSDEPFTVIAGQIPLHRIPALLEHWPSVDLVLTNQKYGPAGIVPEGYGSVLRWGSTLVVPTNAESHGVGIVRLTVGQDGHAELLTFEERELSHDLPEDEAIRAAVDGLYSNLAVNGETGRDPVGFSEHLEQQLTTTGVGGYVGSERCRACHADETRDWQRTRHASAFETLTLQHRDNVAKCVVCHVVGMGLPTGYRMDRLSGGVDLTGVQCEICHGPGGRHVDAPSEAGTIRRTVGRAFCEQCHDAEHSEPLSGRWEAALELGTHSPIFLHENAGPAEPQPEEQ
jgi:hypothetical protein